MTVQSPRGRHYYFAGPNSTKLPQKSGWDLGIPGLDTRAGGRGLAIGPGSEVFRSAYGKNPPPGGPTWFYGEARVRPAIDLPDSILRPVMEVAGRSPVRPSTGASTRVSREDLRGNIAAGVDAVIEQEDGCWHDTLLTWTASLIARSYDPEEVRAAFYACEPDSRFLGEARGQRC